MGLDCLPRVDAVPAEQLGNRPREIPLTVGKGRSSHVHLCPLKGKDEA